MPAEDPRIGTILQGRYRVLQRIAAGGMGVVYRGERLQLGRPVAIKFLHAWVVTHQQSLHRFQTEAHAMSRLSHPSCVSVIDFGVEDVVPYLVMDFVTGTPLRSIIEKGPMPVAQALPICRQLLAGLAHAHGQGIVHRDIKPENILVADVTGLGRQIKILDFGVAKLLDNSTGLTTGFAVGTPSYMSPEQASGEAVDARSDVYAVGVVLFEAVTGHKPFKAERVAEVLRLHREAPPPTLGSRLPRGTVSAALEATVARALAKAPRDRYQSASEFAAALYATPEAASAAVVAGALVIPGAPTDVSHDDAVRRSRERPPWLGRLLVVLGIAAVGSAAVGTWWALRRTGGDAGASTASRPRAPAVVVSRADTSSSPIESRVVAATEPPAASTDVPATAHTAPTEEDLPGIDRVHVLIQAGRWQAAVKALVSLRKEHPASAYVAYLLGNLYLEKLWGEEGFEAYRAAVRGNPAYRQDPTLIRNVIRSFSSDRHAWRGVAFLREEVGAVAIPYLEEASRSRALGIRQRSRRLLAELTK